MSATRALLALLLAATALQAEEKPKVREELSSKLKEEFHFNAATSQPTELKAPGEGVVALQAFTVTEFSGPRRVAQSIQEYAQRLQEQKFTVVGGGPIASRTIGKVEASAGFWADKNGYQLFRLRW